MPLFKLVRFLPLLIGVFALSEHSAFADGSCPDVKGKYNVKWDDNTPYTTYTYWVIPVKSTRLNQSATFSNLINKKYMSNNKPRFSCTGSQRYCVNSVSGEIFSSNHPRYGGGNMMIPDKSGNLVYVYARSYMQTSGKTENDWFSCRNKTRTFVRLDALVDGNTKQDLPYLLLEKQVRPLDVEYYGQGPSL